MHVIAMPYERFRSLAAAAPAEASGALVPLWRDCLLDLDTPVSAFAKIRRKPFSFLLESAPAGGETWARYTFLGTEPRAAWRLRSNIADEWSAERGWHGQRRVDDPFEDLRAKVTEFEPARVPELTEVWSGAVGYLGYDVVRFIEQLPNAPQAGTQVPDALFVLTRTMVVLDNLRSEARVIVSVPVRHGASDAECRTLYDAALRDIDEIVARLRGAVALGPLILDSTAPPAQGVRAIYPREQFLRDVERIREYIFAGDAFQVLLSRRIEIALDFEPLSLYRALRALNPSPYMFHLELDGVELVGSSPELLVRVRDDVVTVRPIAGTRPRGATTADDERLSAELLADEKERAEHMMLVDLGRNDVGRVAEYGSVRVSDLMVVEKYSHVLHIVSQVEGRLPRGASAIGVVRATFPAGTMSGAPKVRAMEIIDELEPERRGAYAGAVGIIAAGDRQLDLAITIRTCVIANGVASVQAGAGIVADSVGEREWEETENKARAMLTAVGRVGAALRLGAHE